jgi:hypothetical protein
MVQPTLELSTNTTVGMPRIVPAGRQFAAV